MTAWGCALILACKIGRKNSLTEKHVSKELGILSAVQAKDTEGQRQMAALNQITFKKPATRAAPSSPSAQFDGPGIMVIAGGAQTGSPAFGRQLSEQSARAAPPVSQAGACSLSLLCLLREAAVLSTEAVVVTPAHMTCLNWQPSGRQLCAQSPQAAVPGSQAGACVGPCQPLLSDDGREVGHSCSCFVHMPCLLCTALVAQPLHAQGVARHQIIKRSCSLPELACTVIRHGQTWSCPCTGCCMASASSHQALPGLSLTLRGATLCFKPMCLPQMRSLRRHAWVALRGCRRRPVAPCAVRESVDPPQRWEAW